MDGVPRQGWGVSLREQLLRQPEFRVAILVGRWAESEATVKPKRGMSTLVLGAVALLGVPPVWADGDTGVAKGKVELSTAASFSYLSAGDSDDFSVLNLPVRIGYFLTDRLAVEAEVLATLVFSEGESETGASVSGLALFHFKPRRRLTPFLLLGAGVGNAVEAFGVAGDTGETVTAFHAGGGLKAFVGDRAAFRLEYRFTHNAVGGDEFYDQDVDSHRIFVGISLFFR
jgi:opacity protein-like surface antigen